MGSKILISPRMKRRLRFLHLQILKGIGMKIWCLEIRRRERLKKMIVFWILSILIYLGNLLLRINIIIGL